MSETLLRVLRGCGVFSLSRALSAGMGRILMYHNFCGPNVADPDALNTEGIRLQLEYLRRNFHVVHLSALARQLAEGVALEPRTVALTIDDGRRSCYQFLFPLLKEFRIPATFFVVSSFIRVEDWIWTDKVIWLSELDTAPRELPRGRLDGVFRTLNRMRPEERNAWIASAASSAGMTVPPTPPEKFAPCSWAELREMADSGLMEIGSHTVTHPILSSITDEESWEELTRSRSQIEEGIGRRVDCFCYPNGMPEDYRASQVQQVKEAGYTCSVIADFGMVSNDTDPYRLPRIGMTRKTSPEQVAKYLDGFAYYQHRLMTTR